MLFKAVRIMIKNEQKSLYETNIHKIFEISHFAEHKWYHSNASLWQYWWYLFWKKGCLALALYVTLSACYVDEQKSHIMSIVFTARIFNYISKMRSVNACVFFQAPLLNKEMEKKVLIRVKFSCCRGLITHWIFRRLPWELPEAHTVLSEINSALLKTIQ